jgi:hypothetical protein
MGLLPIKTIKVIILPDLNTQLIFSKKYKVTYDPESCESSVLRAGKVNIRMCDWTKVALNHQRTGIASHQVQTERYNK